MYERPARPRTAPRGQVTREELEEIRERGELADLLIELIHDDPRVRGAILQVVQGTAPPRQARPTTTQAARRGRGGR